ncbi:hypothetical protein [Promicromonospora panici]|uniref:hypothetical protein n=1 Tax=Promicromonospora panici TaxID=2219658 RepID=UPI001A917D81|nr:hypothetical protein [Promicromonospora panici]
MFYGKDGKLTGSGREHVEVCMLARVLADPKWAKRLTEEDRRGLNALFWSNVNPYGRFHLDMDIRLDLDLAP